MVFTTHQIAFIITHARREGNGQWWSKAYLWMVVMSLINKTKKVNTKYLLEQKIYEFFMTVLFFLLNVNYLIAEIKPSLL